MTHPDCAICRGPDGDDEMLRAEVWSDELWRLTTATEGEVAGFSYLEPRRHIADIGALDGAESATLGQTVARAVTAIKAATGAELVYVYVFGGGISHLHLHLAPYVPDGPLNDQMIKGEVEEQQLPNGARLLVSKDFPLLPRTDHQGAIKHLAEAMAHHR